MQPGAFINNDFLMFCLASVGLTMIVNRAHIFTNLRTFIGRWLGKGAETFIRCPQCVGFWSGIIVILTMTRGEVTLLNLPLYGFVGSLLSYIAYKLIDVLHRIAYNE